MSVEKEVSEKMQLLIENVFSWGESLEIIWSGSGSS